MKIISYNVNGIRAALTKGFADWLKSANPDVLCLQEIKAFEDQIPTGVFTELGYTYQYYHSAEKKGYSGVAILSKIEPKHVEVGTGIDYMDKEGRVLRADFETLSVMSLYLPSGTNPDRLDFKLTFMADFQKYIDKLKQTVPNLVICGDYNNARNNNKGWRIDYHLVSAPLENRMERALILPEAKHSDHCPIVLEIRS